MAKVLKTNLIMKDDDLGVIRKEVKISSDESIETPTVSLKNIKKPYETPIMANEIVRKIDDDLLLSLTDDKNDFISKIRLQYVLRKLNLTLFDLKIDSVPSDETLRLLSNCLYSASDKVIVLPTVKSGLFKVDGKLTLDRLEKYLHMMKIIIDECESSGNHKAFMGTVPLLSSVKFTKPIINLYQNNGITSYAIDAGLRNIFESGEIDLRNILSEIRTVTPLSETLIYGCNLGYSPYEKNEIKAHDFLSIFSYIDIFGTTFKSRGRDNNKKVEIIEGKPPAEQRAKVFSKERYSYLISPYSRVSEIIGRTVTSDELKKRNRLEQLSEATQVRSMVGVEKIKDYVATKSSIDKDLLKQLESIAKLKARD